MARLYTAKVISTGGRNGSVKSADGNLELEVKPAREMGGPEGRFVNPEMLFAAGYSACFNSALQSIMRAEKISSPEPTVTAEVSLDKSDEGKYGLAVTLEVSIPGLDHQVATELVHKAHEKCPYSRAIKGNVEVSLIVK